MPIELQSEMTELRRAILVMGGTVQKRVALAAQGLLQHDLSSALEVRTGDAEINEMDLDIEAEALRILALLHPVAGDLRFVLSVMRINAHLERIADLARSIAKRAEPLAKAHGVVLPEALGVMSSISQEMLSSALDALASEDAALAHGVRRADDRVDDLQKEVFEWVRSELPSHPEQTDPIIDILSVARRIERIADMATNIAEDVIFLVEGAVVRHSLL